MNIKNKRYMQNPEFIERQSSFMFFCQKSLELITKFINECRKGWYELFHPTENESLAEQFHQLTLNLGAAGWYKKNWQ